MQGALARDLAGTILLPADFWQWRSACVVWTFVRKSCHGLCARCCILQVYARELRDTSRALQWLKDSASQLTPDERSELEGCIQGLRASSSPAEIETAARDNVQTVHSPTISHPSPSSAAWIQSSGNAASSTENTGLPLKGDSMQNVRMLPSTPQQSRLSNQLPAAEQASFAKLLHSSFSGTYHYMASIWHLVRFMLLHCLLQ